MILQDNIRILMGHIFYVHPLWHHVTFKLKVFQFWQMNFASYKESSGSLHWAYSPVI